MITITKQDNGVLFEFEDSKKYLYGNGSILVPFNTLSIIADESNMITIRKAASNDIFLSARYDTDLGYRSKDDAIDELKDLLFAETGGGSESGMTPSEVQEMIDESISGMSDDIQSLELTKADTSDLTAVASDVQTVSGQVATKVAITDFNAYSAATDSRLAEDEEVTAAALINLDENKQDALTAGQGIDITNNVISSTVNITVDPTLDTGSTNPVANSAITNAINAKQDALHIYTENRNTGTAELHSNNSSIIFSAGGASITANNPLGINTFNVAGTGVTINNENVATEPYVDAATSGKADTSAVTAAIDAAITGKVDTSAITSSITSGSTDSEIPSAKATYDAITAATTGGGATYSAGTNISIDTANTINCTIPVSVGTGQGSIINLAYTSEEALGKASIAWGYNAKARKDESVAIGANTDVKETRSIAVGQSVITEGAWSCGFGVNNHSYGRASAIFGSNNTARNWQEAAFGTYNNSVTGSTESGNTLFSVGNGTSSANHNAFEIRQNGDIYVNDGTNDVRLQDTILALGGLKFVKLTQAEYDALVSGGTVDSSTIYFITNVVS